MKNTDNLLIMAFETQHDWEAWLEEHHTNTKGIWLKLAKKDTGIASVYYAEALEGALCSGWIDGQKASFDEQYWFQKFTPRSPKSIWSKVNCAKATVLMVVGKRLTNRRVRERSPLIFKVCWTKISRPGISSTH